LWVPYHWFSLWPYSSRRPEARTGRNEMSNWLYDEHGRVRKELYQLSRNELDEKQLEVTAPDSEHNPPWTDECTPGCDPRLWPNSNPALKALESGDTIYVKPTYSVAAEFNGRMTFIAFAGVAGGLPPSKCMFCRTENGGGGFVGTSMLVDPSNPTMKPKQEGRAK
jgi:hypothetical protein